MAFAEDKMSDKLIKRARILYVLKFLCEQTDETHGLTEKELTAKLGEIGIDGDRRLLYEDLRSLELFGYGIGRIGRPVRYYMKSRDFSLPELKLLVDAVQSSRFITVEKSDELIKKLEKLCSSKEARELSRSVHVQNRVKAMNESIYTNVDLIQTAISRERCIDFHYFRWNPYKQKELRNNGNVYTVSPYALTWTDDNYYMIAWDDNRGELRHYRVDKMTDIVVTDLKRSGEDFFGRADIGRYTNSRFGMFGGEEIPVRLECNDSIAGVIIDRFGLEPSFFRASDNSFYVTVRVVPSEQFYGWILGLGNLIKICSPDSVVEKFRQIVENTLAIYDNKK